MFATPAPTTPHPTNIGTNNVFSLRCQRTTGKTKHSHHFFATKTAFVPVPSRKIPSRHNDMSPSLRWTGVWFEPNEKHRRFRSTCPGFLWVPAVLFCKPTVWGSVGYKQRTKQMNQTNEPNKKVNQQNTKSADPLRNTNQPTNQSPHIIKTPTYPRVVHRTTPIVLPQTPCFDLGPD